MKASPIFSRTYDLLRWLVPLTTKFPRQQRFVLATAIQKWAFTLQERLVEAAATVDPAPVLRQADMALANLRIYFRLSHDLGLVDARRFGVGCERIDEVGRLLGGWLKTCPKTRR